MEKVMICDKRRLKSGVVSEHTVGPHRVISYIKQKGKRVYVCLTYFLYDGSTMKDTAVVVKENGSWIYEKLFSYEDAVLL